MSLAHVAADYVGLLPAEARTNGDGVIEALKARLDARKQNFTRRTVDGLVRSARLAELLTPAPRGRAGGRSRRRLARS